jgi:hypothetical protein
MGHGTRRSAVGWAQAVRQGRRDVSIGEALAEARRRAGLTVAQVGYKTGIRETIITAIEDDDYSPCGGDSYARGYIRIIAQAVGADTEPLIREYNTAPPSPQPATEGTAPPSPQPATEGTVDPVTVTRMRGWIWRAWLAVVVAGIGVIWFGTAVVLHHTGTAAPSARAHSVAQSHPSQHRQAPPTQTPVPGTLTPATVPARTLSPVRATAFGPYGGSHGDNGNLASLAIDANPATAWHTDWYATARFGNLYPGTGLLMDMGRPVTITAAQITLGSSHGATLQLRIGTAPALADLPSVADAVDAGGMVRLPLTTPAHGRYVLIWFTGLPPGPAGTFQASVYSLRLEGRI